MVSDSINIPAIKGKFGDWTYYLGHMQLSDVVKRISFADVIHKNEKLSKMIQRELNQKRGKEIASYLKREDQRFFSALVIAVYGGDPNWYSMGVTGNKTDLEISSSDEEELDGVGILSLSGDEKMFAVDGQHRLAGINNLDKEVRNASEDMMPIMFIGHHNDAEGLVRTRRLFTTLNKKAKKVSKGETIALDENDAMAITVRRLVEDDARFAGDRILFNHTNNLPPTNLKALTTIGNLYDVLKSIFSYGLNPADKKDLEDVRASDEILDEYYKTAVTFFDELALCYSPIQEFFDVVDTEKVIGKNRNDLGGHILFRPVGLQMMVDVYLSLRARHDSEECWEIMSLLPQNINEAPFKDVIWDGKVKLTGKRVVRDVLLYMADMYPQKKLGELRKDYAKFLDLPIEKTSLPSVIM